MAQVEDLTKAPVEVSDLVGVTQAEPLGDNDYETTSKLAKIAYGDDVPVPQDTDEKAVLNDTAMSEYRIGKEVEVLSAINQGAREGTMSPDTAIKLYAGSKDGIERPDEFNTGLVNKIAEDLVAVAYAKNQIPSDKSVGRAVALAADREELLKKQMILYNAMKEYQDRADKEGTQWGEIAMGFIPFVSAYETNTQALGEEDSTLSGEVRKDVSRFWLNQIQDASVNSEDFGRLLANYIAQAKNEGASDSKIFQSLQAIYEPKAGTDNFFDVFDVAATLTGAKTVQAGAKAGIVAATEATAKAAEAGKEVSRIAKITAGVKAGVVGGITAVPKAFVETVVPFGGSVTAGASRALKKTARTSRTAEEVATFGADISEAEKAMKKSVSLPKEMSDEAQLRKVAGDLEGAAVSVAQDMKKTNKEELKNSLPTVMRNNLDSFSLPEIEFNVPSIARSASLLTEAGVQDMTNRVAMLSKPYATQLQRLSEEAQQRYIKGLADTLANKVGGGSSLFGDLLSWTRSTDEKGRIYMKTRTGAGLTHSVPFETKKAAEMFKKNLVSKVKGEDYKVFHEVVRVGDGYFVDSTVKLQVGEGTILNEYIKNNSAIGRKIQSSASSAIQSIFTVSNKAHSQRVIDAIAVQASESLADINKKLTDLIGKVSKDDVARIENLIDKSRTNQEWYRPEELIDMGYSDSVVKAYQVRRIINDIQYMYANGAQRQNLYKSGYRKYNGVIGKLYSLNTLKDTGEYKVALKGLDFTGEVRELTGADIKKGYKSAEESVHDSFVLMRPLDTDETLGVDFYIMARSELDEAPLPSIVLNYIAGGRAMYSKDNTFIKQMMLRTNVNNDVSTLLGIRTFFADMDRSKAIRFAEDLEDLRLKYIDGALTNAYLQEKNPELLPFASVDEFGKFLEDNGFSLNPRARIEAVGDGVPLVSYQTGVKEGKIEDLAQGEFEDINYLSRYYLNKHIDKVRAKHRTDKQLVDLLGNDSVRADYNEELSTLIHRIDQSGGMEYYTKMYAESFYDQFKDVIYNSNQMSPYEALMYGVFKPAEGAYADRVIAAKNMQENYKAFRGIKADVDIAVDRFLNNTTRKFEKLLGFGSDDLTQARNYSKTYEKIKKFEPLKKLRAVTFHSLMGLFSAPQFVRQFAQVINSAAVADPSVLGRSLRLYLPVITKFLSRGGKFESKEISRVLASVNKDANLTESEAEAVFEAMAQMPMAHGLQGGLNVDNFATSTLGRISAAPMLAGETGARIYNNLLAVLEAGIGKDGKRWADLSELQKGEVLERANNLYMNMNRTGLSRLQYSEVGKTFLQMQSFNLRFLEALLDPEMTTAMRIRLLGTLLVTTGIQGTFSKVGLSAVSYAAINSLSRDSQGVTDEDTMEIMKVIMNGLGNELLVELTGRNFDYFGGNSVRLLENLSTAQNISDLEIPVFSTASKIADTAITVLKAAGHTTDGSMNYDDFMNVVHSLGLQGKLPSGVNRAAVAYAIFKYGSLYNTRGATVAKDLDEVDALLYYLGFDRREQTIPYLYNYMRSDMNQKKADMLKSLKPLALLYYNKGDFTNMRNVVSLMTQDLSGVERSSIYESLCDYIGKSTRTEPEKILQGLMRSRYIDLANKQTLETAIKVQGGN